MINEISGEISRFNTPSKHPENPGYFNNGKYMNTLSHDLK